MLGNRRLRRVRSNVVRGRCVLPGGVLIVLLGCLLPSSLPAQASTVTVAVEENFRAEPNGTVLARVNPGAVLTRESARGQWVRATLEGWIWSPSIAGTDRDGFDYRVSAEGGENLRAEPNGAILARMEEGALFEEVEEGGDWTRVRRTGWIWAPSLRDEEGEGPEAEPPPPEPTSRWVRSGTEGMAILTAPDGDTLALGLPDAEMRLLGREGNWVRVRLEGWAWLPEEEGESGDGNGVREGTELEVVSPREVMADPGQYRGRVISWELRYISREEAERFRSDFYEGEPYLLTRPVGSNDFFVYVALPPDQVEVARDLTPLERIRVVGRIRSGSAALTGGPVVDLLEVTRSSGSGGGDR